MRCMQAHGTPTRAGACCLKLGITANAPDDLQCATVKFRDHLGTMVVLEGPTASNMPADAVPSSLRGLVDKLPCK